jgi:hypothetical protein
MEAGGRAVVDRLRLLLQPRQLALEIAHEQVGEVMGEAPPHDAPDPLVHRPPIL